MSKFFNLGTFLGSIGGFLIGIIGLLQFFSGPPEIKDFDQLIEEVGRIADALGSNEIDVAHLDAEQTSRLVTVIRPISETLSRNLSELNDEEMEALGSIQDLSKGQTAEFVLPNGDVADVSFTSWPYNAYESADFYFQGTSYREYPGWRADVGPDGCELIFVGPAGDARAARFRVRC